jgi:hypothetical protein
VSVRVCPKPNGDVVVGRRVPGSLDAASVTQLRFTAAEWAEFVEGVRNGGFDSTVCTASRGSRDGGCRSLPQGRPEKATAGQPDGKAGVSR